MDEKFLQALDVLPPSIRQVLYNFNNQERVKEISLRIDKPLVLSLFDKEIFILNNGSFSEVLQDNLYITRKNELIDTMNIITKYSIHSYERELKNGYITIRGGHRVGFCGTFNGSIIKDFSSINIRIARQIVGVADELISTLYSNGPISTLILGSPASGKTTLLKDICRGITKKPFKIAVIDERGELSATYNGKAQNELGATTDIFDGYKKSEGMEIAIRTMSPRLIIIDELAESDNILSCLNAGVKVIATAHANSLEQAKEREFIAKLLSSKAFEAVIVLQGAFNPCKIERIYSSYD